MTYNPRFFNHQPPSNQLGQSPMSSQPLMKNQARLLANRYQHAGTRQCEHPEVGSFQINPVTMKNDKNNNTKQETLEKGRGAIGFKSKIVGITNCKIYFPIQFWCSNCSRVKHPLKHELHDYDFEELTHDLSLMTCQTGKQQIYEVLTWTTTARL